MVSGLSSRGRTAGECPPKALNEQFFLAYKYRRVVRKSKAFFWGKQKASEPYRSERPFANSKERVCRLFWVRRLLARFSAFLTGLGASAFASSVSAFIAGIFSLILLEMECTTSKTPWKDGARVVKASANPSVALLRIVCFEIFFCFCIGFLSGNESVGILPQKLKRRREMLSNFGEFRGVGERDFLWLPDFLCLYFSYR